MNFQAPGNFSRILDTLNRTSDNGLYVGPGNILDLFPAAAGGSTLQTNTYYDVTATVDSSNAVNIYLNGVAAITTTTTALNISSANLLGFFLDNTPGGGQGEYVPGRVALIRLFDSPLSSVQVATLTNDPFAGTSLTTPEPGTMVLLGLGAAFLLAARRRFAA